MASSITTSKIAEIAGVSQPTVSRVINGGKGVAPETVQAVRDAIKTSGYRPLRSGRGRPVGMGRNGVGKRTGSGTIALVIVDDFYMRHPVLALAKMRGVQRAATEGGLNLLVAEVGEDDPLPPLLAQGKVDGVLLWGKRAPQSLLDSVCGPIVWLSSHVGEGGDGVLPGNEFTGRLAADFLMKEGHREVAYLSLADVHPGYEARGEAFGYAVHRAGSSVQMVIEETEGFEPGSSSGSQLESRVSRLVKRLLGLKPVPTGVFVADDQVTAMLYPLLLEAGVRPQKDLSIISCNNEEPYLVGLRPRPATIDLAPEITGRRAVEQLLWRMRNPREERRVQVMVEPILIPGERG